MLLIETFLKIAIFPRYRYNADTQQSRVSLSRENITKTHAIHKHTLLDGEFVIKHTL